MKTPLDSAVPASSNALLRRQNLSTVATLVHRDGPLSRADLTRMTGLNRSAIAALVAELGETGWVEERLPEPTGRIGRPSPVVHPGPGLVVIAVHVDVDAIVVGLVGLGGELLRRIRFDTPTAPSVATVVRVVSSLVGGIRADIRDDKRIIGAGIALPGLVTVETGRVLIAPHLGWNDVDITGPLAEALGVPVYAGNDANLGAVAEGVFGAARGVDDLVYVAGGASGIGGGVVIDGRALRGAGGYAGELGHTLVRSGGAACRCGRNGCLEAEVSLRRLLDVLGARVLDQDELDIALGTSRDPAVLAEVRRQTELLSEGLVTFVHLFNPSMIVLGGFLGSLLTVDRERLSTHLADRTSTDLGHAITIARTGLRSKLELVGAAETAFVRALADPSALGRLG